MHQSKLIELLRKLSPGQMGKFGEFLGSPFFNKNEDNLLFFSYLRKHLATGDEKKLAKETVLSQLKLSKPLDEKGLAYLMSQQLGLLERFLAVEQFLAEEFDQQRMLLQQFHALQLPKHYKSAAARAEKLIVKLPLRNADFFHKTLLFKSLQYEHADPSLHHFDESLQAAADALDVFFLVEKLRLACKMANLENILNLSYHIPFIERVLEWSGTEAFLQLPTVQVYRGFLLLLRNPENTESFSPLKNLLAQNEAIFEEQERKQLYTLLLNHCTRRINRFNDRAFLLEYLEINKLLLENGLILEQGSLQPWRYTNIVHVGLKLGQADWVRSFVQSYKSKLPEAHAENTFSYNLAQYHYHLGEHDKAQRELLRVDFSDDVLLNVGARSLLIKLYAETDQTELLFSFLEATRLFLHRNKLLDPQMKRQLQKFVEVTAKFARLEGFEKEKLERLMEDLPPAAGIMHRDWVSKQIAAKLAKR
jgi:hypothetical protein